MLNKIKIFIILTIFLVLAGCSSKSLYKPESVVGDVSYDGNLPAQIVDVTRSGATLANGQIITKKDGLLKVKIPRNYRFLALNQKKIISTSPTGNVTIENINGKKLYSYNFKSMIASANIDKKILAIVFADNRLMIFDTDKNKILFEKKLDDVYALDARMANPYFLGKLIVFPTLDGRLLIVDTTTYKVLRDIVVSSKPYFNNVIFLSVLDNRLVAATQNRVVSIDPKSVDFMNVGIKDIIFLGQRIFIFTRDGRIILTTSNLKALKEKKFKFANFSTAIYGKFIYVIEKTGYLIAVDKDLITTNVYKLPNAIENLMFTTKGSLYYDNKYFKLSKVK